MSAPDVHEAWESDAQTLYDILSDPAAHPFDRADAADEMLDYLDSGGEPPYGMRWRHVANLALLVLDMFAPSV